MLPLDSRDPLVDNPFIRLGLSVALLRKLSFEQSRELASSFGRFLKKDIFPATNRVKHQNIDNALNILNDEPFTRAAHQCLCQLLDSDALLQKLEEALQKRDLSLQKTKNAKYFAKPTRNCSGRLRNSMLDPNFKESVNANTL